MLINLLILTLLQLKYTNCEVLNQNNSNVSKVIRKYLSTETTFVVSNKNKCYEPRITKNFN